MPKSEATQLAKRWRRASNALDGGLRVAYLASEIEGRPIALAAEALDELCSAGEQAEPQARELLVTLVDLLAAGRGALLSEKLREQAAQHSLLALARLLRRPAPPSSRAAAPDPAEARVPDYGTGRTLTLGERKALARRPTRKAMEKLLADPHPAVIRTLLQNPKVIEDDVVRLVARRPNDAAVLAEVAQSPRWAHRVRVRLAIVLNPDTAPAVAIPLLALLVRPELKQVADMSGLAPALRAAAHDLLQRRPPVRTRSKSGLQ
ncbi:MAG TPA: hypothetical protein VK550_36715 [Polyangiaceae bacterium]|nr:hypothetical protein [Polyangiaceae bacterium]